MRVAMKGGRCLVLNASYEFIHVTRRWMDGLRLMSRGKVSVLASYGPIRTERKEYECPAVVVLKSYIHIKDRRPTFGHPTKKAVLVRDGFKCAYCNKPLTLKSITKDHVIPRCRGGKDSLLNVVACCSPCNGKKGDRTPKEAGMKLNVEPRLLTDDEKVAVITKTHRKHERLAWMGCLREHGLSLY